MTDEALLLFILFILLILSKPFVDLPPHLRCAR